MGSSSPFRRDGGGEGYAPLLLQLLLQLLEEAPVSALGNDLLRAALDHPGLVQTQGVEAHRILGVVLAPLVVRDVFDGLESVVVVLRVALVHKEPSGPVWLERTDVS